MDIISEDIPGVSRFKVLQPSMNEKRPISGVENTAAP